MNKIACEEDLKNNSGSQQGSYINNHGQSVGSMKLTHADITYQNIHHFDPSNSISGLDLKLT